MVADNFVAKQKQQLIVIPTILWWKYIESLAGESAELLYITHYKTNKPNQRGAAGVSLHISCIYMLCHVFIFCVTYLDVVSCY